MTQNVLSLILLTTLTAGVSLNAEPTPTPGAKRTSSTTSNKVAAKTVPAPSSAEGWSSVKGEWVHVDGYKYVNGQIIRTGAQTHKRPPKPPSKALLNSVKIKPTPTPVPSSAATKAAERERNLRPTPASQTGTHL